MAGRNEVERGTDLTGVEMGRFGRVRRPTTLSPGRRFTSTHPLGERASHGTNQAVSCSSVVEWTVQVDRCRCPGSGVSYSVITSLWTWTTSSTSVSSGTGSSKPSSSSYPSSSSSPTSVSTDARPPTRVRDPCCRVWDPRTS